ncbi:MAG: hypothetical protein LBU32_18685 [Clostridiales bacterium]|nr:hypothetical protein [Clostridiales bacterium]
MGIATESDAVYASGCITIGGNATVNVDCSNAYGIYAEGDITIIGNATVNAYGSSDSSIYADGTQTISDSATVNVTWNTDAVIDIAALEGVTPPFTGAVQVTAIT